jgi:hypothetical protein
MMMETESKKYDKVLNILRKSRPVLDSTEDIEREVIKRISETQKSKLDLSDIIDFIFGWVYIGWVRRSLITASVLLVMVFVWQQGVILRRIDFLSRQTVNIGRENLTKPEDEIEKVLTMYKNSGRKFPYKTIKLTEQQMKEMLESINELQNKYKDLENLIEEDPMLKKYIEEKLQENNRLKTKL